MVLPIPNPGVNVKVPFRGNKYERNTFLMFRFLFYIFLYCFGIICDVWRIIGVLNGPPHPHPHPRRQCLSSLPGGNKILKKKTFVSDFVCFL